MSQSQLTFTFADWEGQKAPVKFYVSPELSVEDGDFNDLRDALEAGSNAVIQRGGQTITAGLTGSITPDEPYDSVKDKVRILITDVDGNFFRTSYPGPKDETLTSDHYNLDQTNTAVDDLKTQLLTLCFNANDADFANVAEMRRGKKRR